MNKNNNRVMPAAVLLLLAISTLLFYLLVTSKALNTQQTRDSSKHPATPQKVQYHWHLVTTWPKNFPGLGFAPKNFAHLVEEMSDGRLVIEVHGAGELVPALGVFDAVSSGSVEMGHSAAYYWKGKIPAAPFFTSVPFGMNAQEFNAWLHYGGGLDFWREAYAPFNLIPFAGGNTGVQMGGWFNREINRLDDLKGLKMRMPGFGGEILTRAGGTAVNIPGSELYTSLQTGVIDATEWVGPYNDLAFGFQDIAKYYYYPGWHEPGPSLEFIVNKTAYEALPNDLQTIIEVAARAINQDMLDEYTARSIGALKELKEVHHVDVRAYPEDVIAKLREVAFDFYHEQAARDSNFARIYQNYRAFQLQTEEYHNISERAYYQARER